jgi:hypothetical protein
MTLIDKAGSPLGQRDILAWVNLLKYHSENERRARVTRKMLAAELGFDFVHPRDVKRDVLVRLGETTWGRVKYAHIEHAQDGTDRRWYVFTFFGQEAPPLHVEDSSDSTPIEPDGVIVAVEEAEEPF